MVQYCTMYFTVNSGALVTVYQRHICLLQMDYHRQQIIKQISAMTVIVQLVSVH